MEFNWALVLGNALVPLIMGAIWYNPRVFGNAWMRASGVMPDTTKGSKMALVFSLTILFSLMVATFMPAIVIHQMHLLSLTANQPDAKNPSSETGRWIADAMTRYGKEFRTFKHGAFHGTIAGIFFALPIIGIVSLFERRSARYVLIHAGYWIVTLAIMGGVVCAFA